MLDCVILAGGSIPLSVVRGRIILQHQLEHLRERGSNELRRIILAVDKNNAKDIKDHLDKTRYGIPIDLSIEEEKLGTGGALKLALQNLELKVKGDWDWSLVVNCDDLSYSNISELEAFARKENKHVLCGVRYVRMPCSFILVRPDEKRGFKDEIILDLKTVKMEGYTKILGSCGCYVLNRSILDVLPEEGRLEKQVFEAAKIDFVEYEGVIRWEPLDYLRDIQRLGDKVR